MSLAVGMNGGHQGEDEPRERWMKVTPTDIPGVLVLEPRVFADDRGYFLEAFHKRRFEEVGLNLEFVQDNHSRSRRDVVRGLHYQIEHAQGKLCRVMRGEVFDVAVDLRMGSPTFGCWTGIVLSEENRLQLYLPPGIAHGFGVLSEVADFVYKCTDYYSPQFECTLLWNDPALGIDWPISDPVLSDKDRLGRPLAECAWYPWSDSLSETAYTP